MSLYLFATFASFLIHFFLLIPFIGFLYKRRMQRQAQKTTDAFGTKTPIFDKLNEHKVGTPVGGGILVIAVTSLLFILMILIYYLTDSYIQSNYPSVFSEAKILLFTFISFGLLGLYDDLSKIFLWKKDNFFGLRLKSKLILEIAIALLVSWWLFHDLRIDIIHVPFLGVWHLSYAYILFATFVIVAFANAVNITDGLDGLSSGVLMIALGGFWVIARSIIDVPTSIFIAVWFGGLVAFLYFNVYPARMWLGDTGALAFGATFAVIGLILGKSFALPIIGGVFMIEVLTSAAQLIHKKVYHRKLMPVAPFHLYLQMKGWEEPKVVMRMWLTAILFVVIGLAFAFMK